MKQSKKRFTYDFPRPSVTVDLVLMTKEKRPRVLLIRRKHEPFAGCWAFPGGFVEENEPLEAAARRELKEETGVEVKTLEQLGTFGDPGRDPRGWTVTVAFLGRSMARNSSRVPPTMRPTWNGTSPMTRLRWRSITPKSWRWHGSEFAKNSPFRDTFPGLSANNKYKVTTAAVGGRVKHVPMRSLIVNKRFHLRRNLVLLGFGLATLATCFASGSPATEAKGERQLSLSTDYLPDRINVADTAFGAHVIRLNVKLDDKGDGAGTLSIDPNLADFDSFGDIVGNTEIAISDLAITLKLKTINKDTGRELYEIHGDSLTKRLFLVASPKGAGPNRLIVAEKDGNPKYVLMLSQGS